jgi:hypothetical protein
MLAMGVMDRALATTPMNAEEGNPWSFMVHPSFNSGVMWPAGSLVNHWQSPRPNAQRPTPSAFCVAATAKMLERYRALKNSLVKTSL